MAEREQRFDVPVIVPAVADKQVLTIFDIQPTGIAALSLASQTVIPSYLAFQS